MAARRKAKKQAAKKRAVKKSPARGAAKKRPAKKSRARRAAKKRPAKKRPARRAAMKRVAKKRPAGRAAKQRVAKKRPARKAATKRAVKRSPARRVAKKRVARRAVPAAFAPQKAGASAKDLLLFEIERARVAVLAAIQGIGAGTAARPMGEGKWSIHETVLHLAVRDRVRIDEFDSMLGGNPASWADVEDPADQAAMNESHLAPLRDLSWDDALRLLATTRAELLDRLQAVPAEPAGVWDETHPFGAMMARLPLHDRDHAEAIKRARIAG